VGTPENFPHRSKAQPGPKRKTMGKTGTEEHAGRGGGGGVGMKFSWVGHILQATGEQENKNKKANDAEEHQARAMRPTQNRKVNTTTRERSGLTGKNQMGVRFWGRKKQKTQGEERDRKKGGVNGRQTVRFPTNRFSGGKREGSP